MVLNDETTWPSALVRCLEGHKELFLEWESLRDTSGGPEAAREMARRYDNAHHHLQSVLDAYSLHGYHCTRLTDAEINHISSNGMQLPNPAVLRDRINAVLKAGLIVEHVADRLKDENLAAETNRADMIWFCFYPPHLAGQFGTERLFRSWGGEALYALHERDPITGPILQKIGTPCLVEADIAISGLSRYSFLVDHVYRQFLVNRGLETVECVHHEGYSTQSIPAGGVRRVIRFPEPDFLELTACSEWTTPLK